ncbi:MAG: hypothetical protein VX938_09115, partial [Myxococcota bacterium]|nr:hypothetical protein [Myxococcota bacterium]
MRAHPTALGVALLWFAAVSACSDPEAAPVPEETDTIDATATSDVPEVVEDVVEPEVEVTPEVIEPDWAFTWHRDIEPIFQTMCVRCHQDGAMRENSPLTPHDEVLPWLDVISFQVDNRLMPPWQAASGCSDYHYDISLTDT